MNGHPLVGVEVVATPLALEYPGHSVMGVLVTVRSGAAVAVKTANGTRTVLPDSASPATWWTGHGHWVGPGCQPGPHLAQPEDAARCGGPDVCPACTADRNRDQTAPDNAH